MNLRNAVCLSLAVTLAVPVLARAQAVGSKVERVLSAPNYIPSQGQFLGESGYEYDRTNGDVFDSTGAQVATTRRTLNVLRQRFAYGITDALSVNAEVDYGFSGRARVTGANGASSIDQSGFEDPTFGVTYRLLGQPKHVVDLDLMANYSPDAIQASTGSIARGGPEADVGIAIGHETSRFNIRGSLTGRYFGNASFLNIATGASSNASSHWVPSLRIQTETRLTDRFALDVDADYNFNSDSRVVNSPSKVELTRNPGDDQDIAAGVSYLFIPDRLVGSIRYHHTFFGRSNEIFPANPAQNTQFTRSSDGVGAQFRYAF